MQGPVSSPSRPRCKTFHCSLHGVPHVAISAAPVRRLVQVCSHGSFRALSVPGGTLGREDLPSSLGCCAGLLALETTDAWASDCLEGGRWHVLVRQHFVRSSAFVRRAKNADRFRSFVGLLEGSLVVRMQQTPEVLVREDVKNLGLLRLHQVTETL